MPSSSGRRLIPLPSTISGGAFDLVINTVAEDIDVDAYLSLLALDGTMVLVGLPARPSSQRAWSLVSFRRNLSGSRMGGIRQTQEMLDFCAGHGLGAEVEIIPATRITAAYDRVVAGDVRYRFVIDAQTF